CHNDCTLPTVCAFDLDVVLVMDRSGSMGYDNPTRLSQSKIAANDFLTDLEAGDQSGLVSFATTASLDKQLSSDHTLTKSKVNSLSALGATNIGDAIKLATGELTSARINPSADQIMILLTDGKANKPSGPGYGEYAPDVAYALAKAGEAAAAGIKIFTIGLGSDINATMLQQIATNSGGQYYFAPTASDLDEIFDLLKPSICEPTPFCGDNIINDTEQCDGTAGVGLHQECSNTCTLINLPYCGDSIINGTEQCDDGNAVDTDGCHNDCTLPVYPICTDADNDGYGTGTDRSACIYSELDCDDTSVSIHPAATELCTDGLDNDCDGDVDSADSACVPVAPKAGEVVINELMWMGSTGSIVDEWIELYNTTDHPIDLGNCQLDGMVNNSKFVGKTIGSHGYFLISNYNKDSSKINIDPDIVDTSVSLSNTNLQVKLVCGGLDIDVAGNGGAPLAGENITIKKSMSRNSLPSDGTVAANWFAASAQVNWDASVTELGTPKAENN
ncbi:MAG TPA: VWA domain-containing protein, partial [Patescibacteria group bacterium]|nr:VWA domain-containing protein [Patescibacteria group bacterium]